MYATTMNTDKGGMGACFNGGKVDIIPVSVFGVRFHCERSIGLDEEMK